MKNDTFILIVTAFLIAFLISLSPSEAKAGASSYIAVTTTSQPTVETPSEPFHLISTEKDDVHKDVALIVCGVLVLVVGGIVCYKICKIKLPPPPTNGSPDQPPPPPPPKPPTNHNKTTLMGGNKIYSGDGYVVTTMPLNFRLSNTNEIYTNDITGTTFSLDISNGDGPDYMDTWNTNNSSMFYQMLWGPLPNLQNSTNMIDWPSYTFQMWVSTYGMLTVISDGCSTSICTNYCSRAGGPVSPTTLPITMESKMDKPACFYRLMP